MVETKFRPGPLREILCAQGKNIDRAYSPRAYVLNSCDSETLRILRETPNHKDGMSPVDGDIFVFTGEVQEEALQTFLANYPGSEVMESLRSRGGRLPIEAILCQLLTEKAADPVVVVRTLESVEAVKDGFVYAAYRYAVRTYLVEEKTTLFFDKVDLYGQRITSSQDIVVPYSEDVWQKVVRVVRPLL